MKFALCLIAYMTGAYLGYTHALQKLAVNCAKRDSTLVLTPETKIKCEVVRE